MSLNTIEISRQYKVGRERNRSKWNSNVSNTLDSYFKVLRISNIMASIGLSVSGKIGGRPLGYYVIEECP